MMELFLIIIAIITVVVGYGILCYEFFKDLEREKKETGRCVFDDVADVCKDFIFKENRKWKKK